MTAGAQGAARAPSNLTGAGLVDPVAALTWDVTAAGADAGAPGTTPVAAPAPPPPKDSTPRTIALTGTGVLVLAALGTAAVAAHRRKDEAS